MARKHKDKVDYFPLDVVMDTDVGLLEVRFGLAGYAVFIKLYQYIYGQHGYYGDWDEDARLMFCRTNGITGDDVELVTQVAQWCMDRGLFSRELYEKYQILTSHGIQAQYVFITKRRQNAKIDERFNLIEEDEKISANRNTRRTVVHVNKNTQSIEKEKEIEKEKGKEIDKQKDLAPETGAVGPAGPHERIQMVCDYWNHHVAEPAGVSTVRKPEHWSDKRRRLLKARLKDEGEKGVLDVFDRVYASDFLTGRSGKWQADFDWVLKAENFQKIAEGRYDNAKQQAAGNYYDQIIKGGAV